MQFIRGAFKERTDFGQQHEVPGKIYLLLKHEERDIKVLSINPDTGMRFFPVNFLLAGFCNIISGLHRPFSTSPLYCLLCGCRTHREILTSTFFGPAAIDSDDNCDAEEEEKKEIN